MRFALVLLLMIAVLWCSDSAVLPAQGFAEADSVPLPQPGVKTCTVFCTVLSGKAVLSPIALTRHKAFDVRGNVTLDSLPGLGGYTEYNYMPGTHRLIRSARYLAVRGPSQSTTEYDTAGKVSRVTEGMIRTEYTYRNNILVRELTRIGDSVISQNNLVYTLQNGRVDQGTWYTHYTDSATTDSTYYRYDAAGRVLEEHRYPTGSEPVDQGEGYQYAADGTLTESCSRYGNVLWCSGFSYDTNRRTGAVRIIISVYGNGGRSAPGDTIIISRSGKQLEHRKESGRDVHIYDRRDRLVRSRSYGGKDKIASETIYAYNLNGTLKSKRTTEPGVHGGPARVTTLTYRYTYW